MKALNRSEIENLVEDLNNLVGARLQDILCSENELGLGLYLSRDSHFVWFDMTLATPMMLLFREPPPFKKSKLPIALFLNAHGKSLKLSSASQLEGRVVELVFGSKPDPLIMEVRLFPHGANIIITKGEKKISFAKVKDLKNNDDFKSAVLGARSQEQIRKEWLGRFEKRPISKEDQLKKMISKKREGLQKLKSDNEEKRAFAYYLALGEWLKEHQSLKVPTELAVYLQSDLSLAENIEEAFKKAKLLRSKYEEGKKRVDKILAEIAEIEAGEFEPPLKEQKPRKAPKKADAAKFRTLKLEGSLEAYLGKSGKDNLALLRQAQPWDLWLHLRDRPGAHVIIRKTKNSEVPESELMKTIHWLVKETASKSYANGDTVEIQMQEVRFVRPIKGDSHGRVTVQEPKYRRIRLGKL